MNILGLIGMTLLLGSIGGYFFRYLRLPQVIIYIIIGSFLGVSVFGFYSEEILNTFRPVTNLALGLIGFGIGGELRWARLKRFGISIISITVFESLSSALFVTTAVYLFTRNTALSLLLGALSCATAPGGTTSVLQEYRARGPLTSTLFGVIGADDALAIIIFAFMSNISYAILKADGGVSFLNILHIVGFDIIGSIILGLIFGLITAYVMLKIKHEDIQQVVMLGMLFLCTGFALQFHLSLILSNMLMGIAISNIRPHRSRSYFLSIQKISPPIFILFFILVGARLQFSMIPLMGMVGVIYIVNRVFGKYFGAYFGALLSNTSTVIRKNLGLCLFSQAGVAIGLALSAQLELSKISIEANEIGGIIVNMIAATTFFFQIFSPITTKIALKNAKEIRIGEGY